MKSSLILLLLVLSSIWPFNPATAQFKPFIIQDTVSLPAYFGDGTDRAKELALFILNQKENIVINFNQLRIRADETINLTGIKNTIIYNGTIYTDAITNSPYPENAAPKIARTRAHFRLRSGTDNVAFIRFTIEGPNYHWLNIPANTMAPEKAYNAKLEAQHAFDLPGAQNVLLKEVSVCKVFGDFVYMALDKTHPSSGITVENCFFSGNGRQGFAFVGAHHILIKNNRIENVRRHVFDCESLSPKGMNDSIFILNNHFGRDRLGFFAATGTAPANHIHIMGNTSDWCYRLLIKPPVKSKDFVFAHNKASGMDGNAGGYLWLFENMDSLVIQNNTQPVQANRNMYLMAIRTDSTEKSCNGIQVYGNRYPNGIGEIKPDILWKDIKKRKRPYVPKKLS